ncbi:hypothetical protein TNCT_641411 [Trichonephila clavata]|uniref:Uncharacterized protein n=1 Tax=Trichonephila clavata TaxID=2740835 RepID=A0A8X6JAW2_TRICU|nr:hypothetical protein TNCT_641411 [Trichonephila clavata]
MLSKLQIYILTAVFFIQRKPSIKNEKKENSLHITGQTVSFLQKLLKIKTPCPYFAYILYFKDGLVSV